MTDNFIYSFCKVGFLCYQNEPNWLGIIVLFCLALIIMLIAYIILNIITEVIPGIVQDFFSANPEKEEANRQKQLKKIEEMDAERLRKEELKKAKKWEIEQLSLIQKIIRIIFLPFVSIRDIYDFTVGIILAIIGIGILLAIIYGILLSIIEIFNYII